MKSPEFEWFEIQAISVAYSSYSRAKLIYNQRITRIVYVIKDVRSYFVKIKQQNLFALVSEPNNDQKSFDAEISKRCGLSWNKEFVERLFKEIPVFKEQE